MPYRSTLPRLPALDGLRGCLALFVCLHHVTSYLWLGGLSYLGSQVAVLAFFALSGCVLARNWQGGFAAFLVRRLIRLWPVYALGMVGGAALYGRLPSPGLLVWLPALGPLHGELDNPPAWSLFIEAWAMLAFPLIVWAGAGPPWRVVAACAACVAGAHFVHWHMIYGPIFVFGALASRQTWRSALLERGWAQWLGRVSYSLYLTHWLVLTLFVRWFGNGGVILGFPVMLGMAWLTWWAVERPSILLSRRAAGALSDGHRPTPFTAAGGDGNPRNFPSGDRIAAWRPGSPADIGR